MAAGGIYGQSIRRKSEKNHNETLREVEYFIKNREMSIFARHEHKRMPVLGNSQEPSSVVIFFGNASIGTPLILGCPIWNLHLPLKVAVFDDKEGSTWVAVPDLRAIVSKDHLTSDQEDLINKMCDLLNVLLYI